MALRQDVLVLINEIGLRDVIPVPSDSTETRKRKRSSFEQEIKKRSDEIVQLQQQRQGLLALRSSPEAPLQQPHPRATKTKKLHPRIAQLTKAASHPHKLPAQQTAADQDDYETPKVSQRLQAPTTLTTAATTTGGNPASKPAAALTAQGLRVSSAGVAAAAAAAQGRVSLHHHLFTDKAPPAEILKSSRQQSAGGVDDAIEQDDVPEQTVLQFTKQPSRFQKQSAGAGLLATDQQQQQQRQETMEKEVDGHGDDRVGVKRTKMDTIAQQVLGDSLERETSPLIPAVHHGQEQEGNIPLRASTAVQATSALLRSGPVGPVPNPRYQPSQRHQQAQQAKQAQQQHVVSCSIDEIEDPATTVPRHPKLLPRMVQETQHAGSASQQNEQQQPRIANGNKQQQQQKQKKKGSSEVAKQLALSTIRRGYSALPESIDESPMLGFPLPESLERLAGGPAGPETQAHLGQITGTELLQDPEGCLLSMLFSPYTRPSPAGTPQQAHQGPQSEYEEEQEDAQIDGRKEEVLKKARKDRSGNIRGSLPATDPIVNSSAEDVLMGAPTSGGGYGAPLDQRGGGMSLRVPPTQANLERDSMRQLGQPEQNHQQQRRHEEEEGYSHQVSKLDRRLRPINTVPASNSDSQPHNQQQQQQQYLEDHPTTRTDRDQDITRLSLPSHTACLRLCLPQPILLSVADASGRYLALLLGTHAFDEPTEVLILECSPSWRLSMKKDEAQAKAKAKAKTSSLPLPIPSPGLEVPRPVASFPVIRGPGTEGLPMHVGCMALATDLHGDPVLILSAALEPVDSPEQGQGCVHVLRCGNVSTGRSSKGGPGPGIGQMMGGGMLAVECEERMLSVSVLPPQLTRSGCGIRIANGMESTEENVFEANLPAKQTSKTRQTKKKTKRHQQQGPILATTGTTTNANMTSTASNLSGTSPSHILLLSGEIGGVQSFTFDPLWKSYSVGPVVGPAALRNIHVPDIVRLMPTAIQGGERGDVLMGVSLDGFLSLWHWTKTSINTNTTISNVATGNHHNGIGSGSGGGYEVKALCAKAHTEYGIVDLVPLGPGIKAGVAGAGRGTTGGDGLNVMPLGDAAPPPSPANTYTEVDAMGNKEEAVDKVDHATPAATSYETGRKKGGKKKKGKGTKLGQIKTTAIPNTTALAKQKQNKGNATAKAAPEPIEAAAAEGVHLQSNKAAVPVQQSVRQEVHAFLALLRQRCGGGGCGTVVALAAVTAGDGGSSLCLSTPFSIQDASTVAVAGPYGIAGTLRGSIHIWNLHTGTAAATLDVSPGKAITTLLVLPYVVTSNYLHHQKSRVGAMHVGVSQHVQHEGEWLRYELVVGSASGDCFILDVGRVVEGKHDS